MSCQSIDDIVSNVSDIKTIIVSTGLDISKYFMSKRQIAKKLLSTKSPSLTDKDLNLIVYGKDIQSMTSGYQPYSSESDNMVSYDGPYKAIPDDDPIFDEVENMMSQMITSIFTIDDKGTALTSDTTQLTALISSSVPAMVALAISLPIPNIPGALSLLLIVLEGFSTLKTKMKDILPHLDIFKKIKILIPPSKYAEVVGIICPILTVFKTVVTAIMALETVITKFLGGAKPEDKTSQVQSAKTAVDNAKSDLVKLGYYKTIDDAKNDFPTKDIGYGITQYNGTSTAPSGYVVSDTKNTWINNWKTSNNNTDSGKAEDAWATSLTSKSVIYSQAIVNAKKTLPTSGS